ncbi:hypothetical protein [Tessaracoccus sp. MC1756]|uniref:hypothetical protein n=1 Tax=Tessaracoccus sp. MC1756 TaxID=2760311 RepID=UPI001600B79C|nr:hypothetical protein [Tessaracoccus sp. MC1756]MBB1510635.1 hypothetical protein [Tessaracoccus sp. MC1756]
MQRAIEAIEVDVDEIALSVLGWELVAPQARLVSISVADEHIREVAVSLELRFHPDDWQVRHTGKDTPTVLWQLRSREQGPLSSYGVIPRPFLLSETGAPKMVAIKSGLWESDEPLAPGDLYVWLGGVDWHDADDFKLTPSLGWVDLQHDLIDETTGRGVQTRLTELIVGIRGEDNLEVIARSTHAIGTLEDSPALEGAEDSYGGGNLTSERSHAFKLWSPRMVIEVFDEAGFLLDSRESYANKIRLAEGGRIPSRPATSASSYSFDVSDLPGVPARVVVRLQDDAL